MLTAIGAAGAVVGLANTIRNLRVLRSPASPTSAGSRPVSLLLPLRNEEHRARACLESLAVQECDEIVVLDDNSSDATGALVEEVLGEDPRLRLIVGSEEPPAGWLGKPWACQRLADAAAGDVLVFVDADVVLAEGAVPVAVSMLTEGQLDVICPYPRQVASGLLGRLVQPLLQWSWLTTLPLDVAETSARPSTAAGNGQFLIVDTAAYRGVGGHSAVRGEVLEDVGLVRALKAAGGRGGMADGTSLATCRMYDTDADLVAGYTKSLWAAFGSPLGAVAVVAGLTLAYVVPPVAAIVGGAPRARWIGVLGYAAAVTGRLLVAGRTSQRRWPDALAHPLSIVAFAGLVVRSLQGKRAGTLRWSGRAVTS